MSERANPDWRVIATALWSSGSALFQAEKALDDIRGIRMPPSQVALLKKQRDRHRDAFIAALSLYGEAADRSARPVSPATVPHGPFPHDYVPHGHEGSPLADFIDQCVIRRKKAGEIAAHDLYKAYCDWCGAVGEQPFKQNRFGRVLGRMGFRTRKSSTIVYLDVAFKHHPPARR